MRRMLVAISLISLAFLMFGRRAEAGTGVTADPPNDVFDSQAQTKGPGPLDIASVSHSDDGVRATYVLTLKDGFDDADLHAIHIYIRELPGVAQYDCVPVAAVVSPTGGQMAATLEHCLGSGSDPEGGPGGFDELGPAYYSHSPGSDNLSIAFDLASLRSAGFSGDRYDYSVWLAESGNRRSDSTDPIEHILSPPPTPSPPPATPEPTAPPASRTPASTPVVAVTASNPPVVGEESSFAAPEEASDDAFPVVPVAVGGGAVLAGAGLAAVRFWPF